MEASSGEVEASAVVFLKLVQEARAKRKEADKLGAVAYSAHSAWSEANTDYNDAERALRDYITGLLR